MADAVVQLTRNFLCCLKDLDILRDTIWTDPKTIHKYLGVMPAPMDETTPLELVICVTQFFACVSTTIAGIKLIYTNLGKLKRVHRLAEIRADQSKKAAKDGDTKALSIITAHDRIINDSLFEEADSAMRGIITGGLVTPIGICFFWLTMNSLHITSVDWFGGLPALIHALEVMEICLFPLLYYMLTDAMAMLARANRISTQCKLLKSGYPFQEDALTVEVYKTLTESVDENDASWEPFYSGGVDYLSDRKTTKKEDEQQLQDEIDRIEAHLAVLYPTKDKKEDGAAVLDSQHVDSLMRACDTAKTKLRFLAYRELLYFFLNFVAFYGYLMGPLCYYYEDHDDENHDLHHTKHPYMVQAMRLWYKNVDADWHGNFAGDLMWTIEPIVILGSPALLSYLLSRERRSAGTKIKSE